MPVPDERRVRRRAAFAGLTSAATLAAGCELGAPKTPESAPPPAPSQTGAPPPSPTAEPTPVPEPEPVIPPGDTHFGVNEGFNAALHARQLGARWTRWV